MVGAGGLGCQLLECLASMGFRHLEVLDMDTVDASNLNRQFLFSAEHVGLPKAHVAAERLRRAHDGAHPPLLRCEGHHARLQDLPLSFYARFGLVLAGLDSLVARRWLNDALLQLARCDAGGALDPRSVVPWIDGGVEGLRGSLRVVVPRISACFECGVELFPPQRAFPLCTLASRPRIPEHCVEWARSVWWVRHERREEGEKPSAVQSSCSAEHTAAPEMFDHTLFHRLTLDQPFFQTCILPPPVSTLTSSSSTSSSTSIEFSTFSLPPFDEQSDAHVLLAFAAASARASSLAIPGVTQELAQRVLRRTIPAVASSHAVVAGMMVLEAFKYASGVGSTRDNFCMHSAADGLYTHAFELARRDDCAACSSRPVRRSLSALTTLAQLLALLRDDPELQLASPSLRRQCSDGSWRSLYFPPPSPLAQATRPNLERTLQELLGESPISLHYSDPSRYNVNNVLIIQYIEI